MRKWKILLAAASLVWVTTGTLASAASDTPSEGDPDCGKVFKAKAANDKGASPEQLAADLGLPLEKVNACLLLLRRTAPPAPPHAGQ